MLHVTVAAQVVSLIDLGCEVDKFNAYIRRIYGGPI
jgi:hypothetical protein